MSEKASSLEWDSDIGSVDDLPDPVSQRLFDIETVEDRNCQRGMFAGLGIKAYRERVGGSEPLDTVISDFLGDLMHLCDAIGVPFEDVVDTGRYHYEAEIGGEG